jgi:hypothetical protein
MPHVQLGGMVCEPDGAGSHEQATDDGDRQGTLAHSIIIVGPHSPFLPCPFAGPSLPEVCASAGDLHWTFAPPRVKITSFSNLRDTKE